MAYWLFKSEPNTWGLDDQVKKGAPEEWGWRAQLSGAQQYARDEGWRQRLLLSLGE